MSLLLTVGRSDVMENAASANLMPLPWLLPFLVIHFEPGQLARLTGQLLKRRLSQSDQAVYEIQHHLAERLLYS